MAAMLVSSKKIYLLLRTDNHFNKMRSEALFRFFFKQFMPTIPKPLSADFYGEDVEMKAESGLPEIYLWRSPISTKSVTGDILFLYQSLMNSKRDFESNFGPAYSSKGFRPSLQGFTRDLVLEAYECEDLTYERPTLLRESFSLKNIMHSSEKIVVMKNLNSIPYNQPMHRLREIINNILASLNSKVTTELQTSVLGLVNNERHETLPEAIVSYQFRQFLTMCEAFKLQLQSIKDSLIDQSSYPFLQASMQIKRDAQALYRKMVQNRPLT